MPIFFIKGKLKKYLRKIVKNSGSMIYFFLVLIYTAIFIRIAY